jgi:hypothetical protein
MAYKNAETRRIYRRAYYARNPQRYIDGNYKTRQKIKEYIQKIKKSNPCTDCGNYFPYYVMDFDHLSDKSFVIGRGYMTQSMIKVIAEIKKCELVCSNCHRIRTHKRKDMLLPQE